MHWQGGRFGATVPAMEQHIPEPIPVDDVVSRWGEGPIWHDGRLWYVDIEGKAVACLHRNSDGVVLRHQRWDVGERVGAVVPRQSGGLVIAGDHGFSFFDPATGLKTPIADPEPDLPDNRFNDGKCDPAGRFWAGTISLVKKTGSARLYCLEPDLRVRDAYGPVTNSNGIAWSGDARSMFYIDTPTKQVLRFDYDRESGGVTNPVAVIDTSDLDASPDGMAIDENDQLWIAFCHGGCVRCYDPADGQQRAEIKVPALETTACAFGGDDLGDLYITTGLHKSVEEELAGRVFVVRPGVKGVPARAFAG